MNVDIKITDNSKQVLEEADEQFGALLEALAMAAEDFAKLNITNFVNDSGKVGRVDTGAMRNSITHQIIGKEAFIGTNNEYAVYHEFGTGVYASDGNGRKSPWMFKDRKGVWHYTRGLKPVHFLKYAVTKHKKDYEAIIEKYQK